MTVHRQTLLLIPLVMLTAGLCCTREPPKDPSPLSSTPCTLLIQGTRIQYKGRELPLPGSLDSWEQVLGKHSRKVEVESDVYVWDEAGVIAAAKASTTVLHNLEVLLNPRVDTVRKPPEYWPHQPFKGRLCLDGSDITPSSRIEDINRNKQGQPFSQGYLDRIYSYDITASPLRVYVRIDLTDDRKPESFYMGFSEETP